MTNYEIQMVALLELMSDNPDTDHQLLPKDEQEEVYKRWKSGLDNTQQPGYYKVDHMTVGKNGHSSKLKETKVEYLPNDWGYIFAPIKDEDYRKKLIELFELLDNEGA